MKKFLLSIFCLFSLVGFATADNYSHTFTSGDIKANGTVNLSDVEWTIEGDGGYWGWDSNNVKGVQLGSGSKPYKSLTISTNGISGTITKISINTSGANSIAANLAITIGGAEVGNVSLTNAATDYSFDCEASGNIVLSYTQTSSKAIYIKSIAVEYTPVAASAVAAPTFSVEAGTHHNPFNVEIAAEEGATIYYTTDGTEPTAESAVYAEAIAINKFNTSTTIKAVAAVEGELSNVASATYSLKVAAPVFSVKGGVYEKVVGMAITSETEGTEIFYTDNGKDPIENGNKVWGNKSLLSNKYRKYDAKAVAVIEVEGEKFYSEVANEKYYISPIKPFKKAAEFAEGQYLIYANSYVATALSESSKYGYLPKLEVTEKNNYIENHDFYAFTFTAVEGGYTIQDIYGRYLYMTGTYDSFNVAAEMPAEGAVWTVAIDETTGEATITNAAMNKFIQFSTEYKSFGSYAAISETNVLPTLFAVTEYPTMTVTPENYETIPTFNKVTVTCEQGIAYNGTEELYATYSIDDADECKFDDVVVVDENTIEFILSTPIEENCECGVTFPAGLFTLCPNGLDITSKNVNNYYTIDNPKNLVLTYANPDNGASVKSIEYLYFEFNQDIIDQADGAVITNENGDEFPLTVTYTDAWGDATPYNALCLKTAEPITAAGTYTFVLKKEYFYAGTDTRMSEDLEFVFTIKESLKIVSISPVEGEEISAISEFIIECNQDISCFAEAFLVLDADGNEYYFTPSYVDNAGNEMPFNTLRLVAETPITAAGTYTLYIEDMSIMVAGEYTNGLEAYQYTFTFDGSKVTTGIDNVESENAAKVIYDLTGRKIENITKAGIYIVNGKKVLVK